MVQANGVGHNLSIIDPATNKVVAEIKGIEAAHGVAAAKDGSRIYVSEKADRSLDVVDRGADQKKPLSGVPNIIARTPDRRFLYVAITLAWEDLSDFPQIKAAPSGGGDVIDTVSLQNIKTIPIKGGIRRRTRWRD
jgi:DNA-binding beta-propeller fold protein YncE